jgi:hypothetical protein
MLLFLLRQGMPLPYCLPYSLQLFHLHSPTVLYHCCTQLPCPGTLLHIRELILGSETGSFVSGQPDLGLAVGMGIFLFVSHILSSVASSHMWPI